jgi:hypothetical protein
MIIPKLAGFTALSAIQHSTAHPSKLHGSSLNNCRSFYSQFEFWNLAKIILFGSSFRFFFLIDLLSDLFTDTAVGKVR